MAECWDLRFPFVSASAFLYLCTLLCKSKGEEFSCEIINRIK